MEKSKKISIFDFSFNLLLSVCPKGFTIEELSRQVSISEQTDNDIPCYIGLFIPQILTIQWFVVFGCYPIPIWDGTLKKENTVHTFKISKY